MGVKPSNASISVVANDYGNNASSICKNCNEISRYGSVPCYWDNGSVNGGNIIRHKLVNGSVTKVDMWLCEKSSISRFSSTTFNGAISRTPIALTSILAASLNLTANYFFFPVASCTDAESGSFYNRELGEFGDYWPSTPCSEAASAYGLGFDSTQPH